MNVHGIEFRHRRQWDLRDFVALDFAQFTAFAALLESRGLAAHVTSVDYETAIQSFVIEADPDIERLDAGYAIALCANQTLSQYFLFDRCDHKNSFEDEAGRQ